MLHLKGLKDLVIDAIDKTTHLVERTHFSIADKYARRIKYLAPDKLVETVDDAHRHCARGVYASIRGINRGVGAVTDVSFSLATRALGEDAMAQIPFNTPLRPNEPGNLSWWLHTSQGALNGVIGDYLNDSQNGLEIPMGLRHQGHPLAVETESLQRAHPQSSRKVCIFVHGLGCTEWSWNTYAKQFYDDPDRNFGSMLQHDLGYTPLYVRYNTGLHVSDNGQRLSDLIGDLLVAYPEPIDEILLIGHSMGGLVVRSAAHYGEIHDRPWIDRLQHVFCIGSPHYGAPLEKVGNVLTSTLGYFDTPGTQIPAQILNIRSAGVKDLRFGYVVDQDWEGYDSDALLENNRTDIALVDGVGYYFISSTITRDEAHPMGHLVGDLLVRPHSAAGQSLQPVRHTTFRFERRFSGMHHFHLANHPDVYQQIKSWIAADDRETAP